MASFRVGSATLGTVEVESANWLIALGEGLVKLGVDQSPDRLACERLANGTVLVRDVRSGAGFVVQPTDVDESAIPEGQDEIREDEHTGDSELPPALPDWDEDGIPELDTEDVAPPSQVLSVAVDAIANAHDAVSALSVAVVAGVRLSKAKGGSALLVEENKGLRFVYVVGDHAKRLTGMRIPAGAGVAGFAVSHQVALVVNEAYSDPRFYRNVDKHTGHRTGSLLCVPVAAGGTTFGCIEMIDSYEATGFSDSQLAEVLFVATAAGNRLAALAAR